MDIMRERPYYVSVWKELDARKRLILISGPRQSGKTTLAKSIGSREPAWLYFNYDVPRDRQTLLKDPAFFQKVDRARGVLPLIVLDEIHKYRDWKNYLKGAYDGYSDQYRFLVTGSGRLDLYQRRGDSLAGRYWQFHLFPFTIAELFAHQVPSGDIFSRLVDPPAISDAETADVWAALSQCSGFPEPFLSGEKRTYRRWAAGYHRQVLREDVRDAFAVKQIDTMESLYHLLPDRTGSSFSASGCAELLRVSHSTISSWIEVFKRFYLVFSIRPYHHKVGRSLLKEPKLYFYDFIRVQDEAARFENMVALELARATSLWTDQGNGDFDLYYLRTKERREVDFLVTRDGHPFFMVEAKLSDTDPSPNLAFFQNILDIPAIQVVNRPGIARVHRNARHRTLVVTAARWLAGLG
jgi:predicted AAA+ superfamily ATPase